MTMQDIGGIGIDYTYVGDAGAPVVVITPGGRYPKETPGVPQLARALADAGKRVLLWDRPNCGASDICFAGKSESSLHAQVLIDLLRALGIQGAALAGGSAGSRVSLIAAARIPETVSHLAIWWISGGAISLAQLAGYYCGDAALAATRGGMESVAAMQLFAEPIARNAGNRARLMTQEPQAFIARMEQWASAYMQADKASPVPGMSQAEFARLTMPVRVFRSGQSDLHHPRRTSEWVHRMIPHSELIEPPWPDQEWNNCQKIPNQNGRGRFERWPLLAPQLLEFFGR
jgi:pimeloyl-ACP methyl ester carboxylesterase